MGHKHERGMSMSSLCCLVFSRLLFSLVLTNDYFLLCGQFSRSKRVIFGQVDGRALINRPTFRPSSSVPALLLLLGRLSGMCCIFCYCFRKTFQITFEDVHTLSTEITIFMFSPRSCLPPRQRAFGDRKSWKEAN